MVPHIEQLHAATSDVIGIANVPTPGVMVKVHTVLSRRSLTGTPDPHSPDNALTCRPQSNDGPGLGDVVGGAVGASVTGAAVGASVVL